MRLTQLQIHNFRNLKKAQFTPVNGVNLILGDNASGKTSLLEAIYYLSHVRSFRTQYVADLILRESPYLQLVAYIENDSKQEYPLEFDAVVISLKFVLISSQLNACLISRRNFLF